MNSNVWKITSYSWIGSSFFQTSSPWPASWWQCYESDKLGRFWTTRWPPPSTASFLGMLRGCNTRHILVFFQYRLAETTKIVRSATSPKKKNCARLKSPNINLHKLPNVYPRGGMKPSTKHSFKAVVLASSSFTVVYGCDICEVINHHKSRCPRRSCRQGADIPMCFLLRRGKSYAFIADHKL